MKNKRLLSFLMALVMMISFGGCAKKGNDKNIYPQAPKGKIIRTIKTDDGIEINFVEQDYANLKIGKRNYKVYDDHITYEVQKGDNDWSIARDFNLEEEDIREFNNMESDLMYPGDKIVIPRSLFGNSNDYVGIEVSEENGDINWDLTKYFTDFVLVEAIDFDCDKFHKYIESKGGYDKALADPNFGKDYDEFEFSLIDENFDENMKALEERNIPHGIITYGYLDYKELGNAKTVGKEDADQLLSSISKYKIDYPVVFAIDHHPTGPFLHASGDFDDRSDETSKKCLDYCLSFMNEVEKYGYDVYFCSDSDIYNNFVSKDHSILKYKKIITDDYDETQRPTNVTNIEKTGNKSIPGLEWSKRFCNTYIDNSKVKYGDEIINNESKAKSKTIKILVIGGCVVVLLGTSFLGLGYGASKAEAEMMEVPSTKSKKRKKK